MAFYEWIIGLSQLETFIFGIGAGVIVILLLSKLFIKKKKPKQFLGLRELIHKRYAQLIEGAKGYHEIIEVLNEVERNAER